MINETYINKIEDYIKQREASGKAKVVTKGLLARNTKGGGMDIKAKADAIQTVGEYVYSLRQKRNELKAKREKNGNK